MKHGCGRFGLTIAAVGWCTWRASEMMVLAMEVCVCVCVCACVRVHAREFLFLCKYVRVARYLDPLHLRPSRQRETWMDAASIARLASVLYSEACIHPRMHPASSQGLASVAPDPMSGTVERGKSFYPWHSKGKAARGRLAVGL